MIPRIYLRKGKEESLARRHPWIFSGAIDYIEAEEEAQIAEGALVEIYTRSGDFIALGHYQIGSIAVRVLSFEREEIDQTWWNRRIAVARERFNAAVQAYNVAIRRFPAVVVAGIFGFERKPYFQAAEKAQEAPVVEF